MIKKLLVLTIIATVTQAPSALASAEKDELANAALKAIQNYKTESLWITTNNVKKLRRDIFNAVKDFYAVISDDYKNLLAETKQLAAEKDEKKKKKIPYLFYPLKHQWHGRAKI